MKDNDFTKRTMATPNFEVNGYFNIGDRWCGVKELLKDNKEISYLLDQFAFAGRDNNFSFSADNLKCNIFLTKILLIMEVPLLSIR